MSSGTLCPLGSLVGTVSGVRLPTATCCVSAKGCRVQSSFPTGQIHHAHSLHSCTRKDFTKAIPLCVLRDSQSSYIHVGGTESILGSEVRAGQEVQGSACLVLLMAGVTRPLLALGVAAGDPSSGLVASAFLHWQSSGPYFLFSNRLLWEQPLTPSNGAPAL